MKSLFVTFIALISLSSFACDQYELQFIGTVDSVEQGEESCLVKLESPLKFSSNHILCPLYEEEILATGITIPGECNLFEGVPLSGVAVRLIGDSTITVE